MTSFVKKLINSQKVVDAEKGAFSGEKKYFLTIKLLIEFGDALNKVEVFVPQSRNTDYQKVSKSEFSLQPKEILKDFLYDNEVAYWNFSDRRVEVNQKVQVSVKPRLIESISGNLADYEKEDEEYKLYAKSDAYFDFENERVFSLAKNLLGKEQAVGKIAKTFYEYVRDNLKYGNPIEGLYSSKDALDKDVVDCGGYDSLLGALYRSVGIPSRLVSGLLAGYPGEHMHAWLEFMAPNGTWVPVDPTNEHLRLAGRDFKPGGFGRVGNDRIVLSYGDDIEILGRKFPLLQLPVIQGQGNLSVERFIETKELK